MDDRQKFAVGHRYVQENSEGGVNKPYVHPVDVYVLEGLVSIIGPRAGVLETVSPYEGVGVFEPAARLRSHTEEGGEGRLVVHEPGIPLLGALDTGAPVSVLGLHATGPRVGWLHHVVV